jgi:hypothetical protein
MDKALAILLGNISSFISDPSDEELAALGGPSMQSLSDPGPIRSSFARIFRYPDKTVLVYQGTGAVHTPEGVRDWLANFSAVLVPTLKLPGLVHLGSPSSFD